MNTAETPRIYIIGAGISGLVAAINLEKKGFRPIILERDTRPGGRVQTDVVEGFQLDRGFQVLLEAYPKAQEYLDYGSLQLQPLSSGAVLFHEGKGHSFGDPLREPGYWFPTLTSPAGSLGDKLKIFQLKRRLKNIELESIFDQPEQTTGDYLKTVGFSDQMIQSFFRPFFSGIFLEPDLQTSSRMFEYVYKLFGQGRAMIPKAGIGAIAQQLVGQLKQTDIRYGCEVAKISSGFIHLNDGESLEADFIVVATNPAPLLDNFVSTLAWKSCDNLYFRTPNRTISKPVIGLSAQPETLVNNLFYASSVDMEHRGSGELLSVTVVKSHELGQSDLIASVNQELKKVFGIEETRFLKHYRIAKALPQLQDLKYTRESRESLLTDHIAIAGDHQLNGSLNAAMISGENAANAAEKALKNELLPV